MSVFTRVRRFTSLEEARVTCAFLRSGGIDAELDHHEACSTIWIWGGAVAIDLRVPTAQAEDSIAAMTLVRGGSFALPDVEPIERTWTSRAKGAFLLLLCADPVLLAGCAFIAFLSLSDPSTARSKKSGGLTTP